MNSIILKELLSSASRHKGEPLPAAIKIIVDYVEKAEKKNKLYNSLTDELQKRLWAQKEQENKHLKYIGELEERIDELEKENE